MDVLLRTVHHLLWSTADCCYCFCFFSFSFRLAIAARLYSLFFSFHSSLTEPSLSPLASDAQCWHST
ncbi:hypothetical protein VTH06DRAFT_6692 [Thermothelomyces fergusii]